MDERGCTHGRSGNLLGGLVWLLFMFERICHELENRIPVCVHVRGEEKAEVE